MNSGVLAAPAPYPCIRPYTVVHTLLKIAPHGNQSGVLLGSLTASKPRTELCINLSGASGGEAPAFGSSLSGSAFFIKGKEASFIFQGILASPSRILKL